MSSNASRSDEKVAAISNDVYPTTGSGKVTLDEYMAEARRTRARENGEIVDQPETPPEKRPEYAEELAQASRALRTAGWAAVFYLITTDILGPFNAPFAFSQVGYVAGAILYVVMGLVAGYGGLLLWRLFLNLDSDRYPVKTYADLCERVFGTWFKHTSTVLQTVQLIINVGTICLSNAQSLEQMTNGREFCFSVAILIWALFGMVIGQIRSLKNYGWLANSAVWLNLSIIFISMGFIAHSPPNFAAAETSLGVAAGPIVKSAFTHLPLFSKVNGIMNMVFAWGGSMIFPEFMAEMRRPMDFWKGMVCAQGLICVVYLMYGVYVYSFQGQFTLGIAYQGVSKFAWQTVGNAIGLVSSIIAAGLYGNIGIKVAYYSIVEDMFKGPKLTSKQGRVIWIVMVVVYWSLAFVVGSAIPQVQTVSALVAAICIMQFTYTFPPLLYVGYVMKLDAAENDTGDTWRDFSRWKRGFFTGRWDYKLFNVILALGSAAMACLGMYGAGKSIQMLFQVTGAATSFGCKSPV